MGNSSSKIDNGVTHPAKQKHTAHAESLLQAISTGNILTGRIDPTYITIQRDFFESGLAAEIGSSAFMILCAIKAHADFRSGACRPSIRRLMALTGSASATVQNALDQLQRNRLLHIYKMGRQNRYVAREHLPVKIGGLKLCTIIINYIPANLQQHFRQINDALLLGEFDLSQWPDAEIIPAPGFVWQQQTGLQKIPSPIYTPATQDPIEPATQNAWSEKIQNIQNKARAKAESGHARIVKID